jgi:DNA-binding transcriptional LysR family regulator
MDIHHLRIFTAVYRHRSFSRASEELHISQPTISEHIKNLEMELDCKLFDRLGRSILPTREADILYPRSLRIVEDLQKITDAVSQDEDAIMGNFTIGASTIPGTYILPDLAARFKRKNPRVSFEIRIEDSKKITDLVVNHELLIGVVGAKMKPDKLIYRPFIEDELILASSEKVIKGDSIHLKNIVDVPFIMREEGSGTRKTMERFLSEKKLDINSLNVTAVLGSTDSVKQALKAGLGVSALSRVAIKDELRRGVLKEIRVKGLKMKRYFFIIRHKKRSLPNPYRAFHDFILHEE